jgi:hypothetical protein
MPWKIVSTDLYFFVERVHYASLRITGYTLRVWVIVISTGANRHKKILSGTGEDFTIIYLA